LGGLVCVAVSWIVIMLLPSSWPRILPDGHAENPGPPSA
jgi:hypothetical protein